MSAEVAIEHPALLFTEKVRNDSEKVVQDIKECKRSLEHIPKSDLLMVIAYYYTLAKAEKQANYRLKQVLMQ